MKKIIIYFALLIGIQPVVVLAQVSQTAVPFLLIAPGARAGGMGETFVSIADDATATHWNPAGLGKYPLSPDWIKLPAGQGQKIERIALVKNDMPDNNYKQYDIWAVVSGRIAEWVAGKPSGVEQRIARQRPYFGLYTPLETLAPASLKNGYWKKGINRIIDNPKSLKSIVARFAGIEENQAEPLVKKILNLNNGMNFDQIDTFQQTIAQLLPSDYQYKDEINAGFARLKGAWSELKIDTRGYSKFSKIISDDLADRQLSTAELDSLAFGFDTAISKTPRADVYIPYDLVINSNINCYESHDGMVYVGTDSGFYRFDPKGARWKSYGLADSLPSLKITALEKMGRKSIVVGTDSGLVYFNGIKIKTYSPNQAAPSGHIVSIAALSDQDIWAATETDLYHYDGATWKNYAFDDVTVGEDLTKIMAKFYRAIAVIDSTGLKNEIVALNDLSGELTVGQKIKLPFAPNFRGKITNLAARDKNVWIGTDNGVILYNSEAVYHFGYREYKAAKDITIQEIAESFLPQGDTAKINRLAEKIKSFNRIEGDVISANSTVLVYANVLGSSIYSIAAPTSKKAYVGTAYGVVEYNDGVWSRYAKTETIRTPVHSIKNESGELWFATTDHVYVLAQASGQVTFMHSNYLVQLASDLYYDYFAIAYPTSEYGTFGMGITFLSYGQQDRTNEIGTVIGQFNSYDFAWTVSYGTKLARNLAAGISGKVILSHLADVGAGLEKGKGVGFSGAVDGGIIYEVDPKLTLASTITNIGPEIAYIDADQADPLPRKLAVAFAYKLVESPFNRLTIVGEANKLLVGLNNSLQTEIDEIIPHIGAEYWYSNYFALRAGYVYDKVGVQHYVTLGGSLQYNRLRIDLSYIPSSNENTNRLGNTIRISLNVAY